MIQTVPRPVEISFQNISEAQARLVAMPHKEIEAVCLGLLKDIGKMSAGYIEMTRGINEARTHISNGENDPAGQRLDQLIAPLKKGFSL